MELKDWILIKSIFMALGKSFHLSEGNSLNAIKIPNRRSKKYVQVHKHIVEESGL